MKRHSFIAKLHVGIVVLFLAPVLGVLGQMPGAGGSSAMTAAMSKLFGEIKGFSAKAQAQVLDSSQKEMVSMPMTFEFLDGKIRVQLDMAQMKNANMPPGAVEQLKKMGMSQVISVVRPDKNLAYVIYPDNKVLMSMPLPKEADTKVTRTDLGKETIDGHACAKTKVVISGGKDQSFEATTWNASDLKDFPIQIRAQEKENTSVIHFSNVQLAKPDAQDFEPPAGYTQYNSPQEMMQGMMSKMQDQGQKK